MKQFLKNLLFKIKGGYQPKKFWNKWASTFMDDPWQSKILPQHPWMLQKILASKPKSILEIGCGFGRNIKYFIDKGVDAKSITGVDISWKMIERAKAYINNNNVRLFVGGVENLPFNNKSFDFIIIHAVFMHVKPRDINRAISEVLRVGRKDIIVIEQNYSPGKDDLNANQYTFIHNYKKLFKEFKLQSVDLVKSGKFGYYYFHLNI